MIVVAAILLAVPPAPSGQRLPYGEVEIVNPIVPMVSNYLQCLETDLGKSGGIMTTDRELYRRLAEAAIRACAEVRATGLADAERALARAPDYQAPSRRQLAIQHAFDGTDEQIRHRPEIMDQVLHDSLALRHRNDHAPH